MTAINDRMALSLTQDPALRAETGPGRRAKPDCPLWAATADAKIICHCLKVSESRILRALEQNPVKTVTELAHRTQAGLCCMACRHDLQAYVAAVREATL